MNEERQNAYLSLINALVNCPNGEEAEILKANQDLIDAGLLQTMDQVAARLARQGNPNAANWLRNVAAQLAKVIDNSSTAITPEMYQRFLVDVLRATNQSNADPQVVYPILQANLDKLDDNFAKVLRDWATATFPGLERDTAWIIARDIGLFSDLIQKFPYGTLASNLEIAISAYEVVGTVLTREVTPEVWATIQHNLGSTYCKRIREDKAENLEQGIRYYQAALQVRTSEAFPFEWANTKTHLGAAYIDRIKGDRADNLEQALRYCQAALQVFTREALPKDWAAVQYNLGNVYKDRIKGDRADNLEQAIHCYQAALHVRTHAAFPKDWADTQNNLGNVYLDRIRGDKVENLEQAIQCYQAALQIYTPDAFPQEYAITQTNLGAVYCYWMQGDKAENLEKAIQCYQAALQVYTPDTFPQQWGVIKSNLGVAYSHRLRGDKAENLEQAIQCYQAVLQLCTHDTLPLNWAKTQVNLGNAYKDRIVGDKAENFQRGITCYEAALQVLTRQNFPQDWANIQYNLGLVYRNLGQIDLATACFRSSLEVFTSISFPVNCHRSAFHLGNYAFAVEQWAEAIDYYRIAIEALETTRSWISTDARRQEIQQQAIVINNNLVQACINNGQLDKALECVERSRSKRLVDLMTSSNLDQGGEIRPEVQEYLQQYENLQQRIDQERFGKNLARARELIGVGTKTSFSEASLQENRAALAAYNQTIKSLEAEKQRIWEQLRRLDLVLAGQVQVSAPNFTAIQQLIDNPTTAILSFYTTLNDTYVFVVRQSQITCHSCLGKGMETLQDWIGSNWLVAYVNNNAKWRSQIHSVLTELSQRLQLNDLIAQHLSGIEEIILVPHLYLHQIPLAALPIGNGQYLGDKFLIRYTPSCQVLEFCKERGEVRDKLTYGTVEDATEDLPFASFEGEQIAQLYNIPESDRLKGRCQCTKINYRQLASRVQVLHSCHHAQSRLDEPLESVLKLADETITLGELLTPGWRLVNLCDVFLSCCETGLGVTPVTDDILTLSTGFLCAGARSVVSTLWAVNDLATALFSIFYYQHRQQGCSRPEAVQQAQIKLRELNKEELLNREDIKELSRQAEAGRKEARNKRSQYELGSADYLKWDCEYRKYASVTNQIHSVKNSQDQEPFSHPRYWAAFTCSGLR
jgi:CHAT domain-containing protein/predicted NBD/HSP70 family sugar kinase